MYKTPLSLACIALSVALLAPHAVGQQIWYVWTNSPTHGPGSDWSNAFQNIQSAVNAASAGDTILVTNGTYLLASEVYCGVGVTIKSVSGYSNTVISGNNKTRCLWTGYSSSTVIDGFTFRNGVSPDYGGGVYLRDGMITNCLIKDCYAPLGGGGVYSVNGIITDCTITSNRSASGGGIYCLAGTITRCAINSNLCTSTGGGGLYTGAGSLVQDCVISRNICFLQGGGVYGLANSSVFDCTIRDNSAGSGGGIYTSGSASNCVVLANKASATGGGVTDGNTSGYGVFLSCAIVSNQAADSGGGVTFSRGGVLRECLVSDNTASNSGGGIYSFNAGGIVSNCVISRNSCYRGGSGGGVYAGVTTLQACIISSNTATKGGGVHTANLLKKSTIHHNNAKDQGGGVYCAGEAIVDGCNIYGNTSGDGGGVYAFNLITTVRGCLLTGNSATNQGGGIWSKGTVLNCTIASNVATNSGGGVYNYYDALVFNSVLAMNSANVGSDHYGYGQINYSRAAPMPPGVSNTISDPIFADEKNGNYRLHPSSPCVDSGTNMSWMTSATDLDGRPRLLNGKVDMGAYEIIPLVSDIDADGIPDWWEWDYTHSLTSMPASLDMDADGSMNLQEYIADTDPKNSTSFFYVAAISNLPTVTVTFPCSPRRYYTLQRCDNLKTVGWSNVVTQTNIKGEGSQYSLQDATAATQGFYRVEVKVLP